MFFCHISRLPHVVSDCPDVMVAEGPFDESRRFAEDDSSRTLLGGSAPHLGYVVS